MGSYMKHASAAYVVGYWVSATLAISLAFAYGSYGQTAVILSIITGLVWVLATYVEKQSELLSFIPVFLQAILFTALNPGQDSNALVVFTIISSLL